MRRRPEQKIRLECKKLLKTLGFSVYDMEQNRRTRQTPGVSDLICFGHGLTIFAEIKTPTGTQSDFQKGFEEHVSEGQGIYVIWRDVRECWDWLVEQGIIEALEPAA